MARAKAKRNRYECGKLVAEVPPAVVRRAVDLAKRGATDSRLGSYIGRLRLENQITDEQCSAGLALADLAGRYYRAQGITQPSTRSPAFEVGIRSTGDAGGPTDAIVRRRYEEARHAVATGTIYGPVAWGAIQAACVEDIHPSGHTQRLALEAGLTVLAVHFGLMKRGVK